MASFFNTDHATELVFGMIEFVIIPFLIYSFFRLRKHINAVYFNRRGKTITISWFISLTLYNVMLIIIIISYLFYNQSVESFIFSSTISSTIHHMIGSSSIWMNLCRCWQLYYNKKYYQGLQNAKWRSKINQNDTDFYVKYRSRIGNTIYFIATLLWFIDGFAFVSMSTFFACPHCEIFAEFPSYLTFYLFASIILCLSGIDDIFFIRRELIYIITFQACGSLLAFILNIFIIHFIQFNIDDILFKNIIPAFIGCITSVGVIYFGVHWVIKKNLKRSHQQSSYLFGSNNTNNNNDNNNDNDYDMMPLKEILTDKSALDLFMQHLVREFSVENVLFLIEAANFKRLMIKLGYIDEDTVPLDFLENVHKKNGRSASFSLSMPAKISFINHNDLVNVADSTMQLSLLESIKVVQNMNNNVDTHFTSTSSFLRSLSRTTNKKYISSSKSKGKKKKSDKIEMNIMTMGINDPQQKQSKSLEKEIFAAPKLTAGIGIHSSTPENTQFNEVPKRTSIVTTSGTSTKRSTPQSMMTPEPASISPINTNYYVTEAKKKHNGKQVKQITLENIEDIDDIIDSQYEIESKNSLNSEQLLEEEKHNEFKEKDVNISKSKHILKTPTISGNKVLIELKSPSIHQMRSHNSRSISKSKSPFTFNSSHKISTTANQKKYLQTQRQMEATWINFPRNVPISPFLSKQKGGKYLNPWIIVCEIIEKYIQNSSMLCINVSWNVRQSILKFMEKHEHIYEEYYGEKNRKSSLSVIFSSLSWKRKNKNKIKKSVDGSYHPLQDYGEDDIIEIEDHLIENSNKKKKEVVDEEQVLKELAILFDASCMEIYCLLGDSYTRFVTTKQYQILLKKRKNYIKQWIKKKTASVASLNGNY